MAPRRVKGNEPLSNSQGHSRVLPGGNYEILGAPVGSTAFCASHTDSRIKTSLATLTAVADLEDPQVALRLQRRCQGFAKLCYSARVVPPAYHTNELRAFDAMQRETFEGYMSWRPSDSQWSQASRGSDTEASDSAAPPRTAAPLT